MRVTGDIKVRDGLVFLDGWVVCECGTVECDTAETLIRQLSEHDEPTASPSLKVCTERW